MLNIHTYGGFLLGWNEENLASSAGGIGTRHSFKGDRGQAIRFFWGFSRFLKGTSCQWKVVMGFGGIKALWDHFLEPLKGHGVFWRSHAPPHWLNWIDQRESVLFIHPPSYAPVYHGPAQFWHNWYPHVREYLVQFIMRHENGLSGSFSLCNDR